jgi:hypothetical protein
MWLLHHGELGLQELLLFLDVGLPFPAMNVEVFNFKPIYTNFIVVLILPFNLILFNGIVGTMNLILVITIFIIIINIIIISGRPRLRIYRGGC